MIKNFFLPGFCIDKVAKVEKMYQFKISKVQEGGYKFELDGIKLLIDDYSIMNDMHLLKTPNKAIAFFNMGDDVYGISNEPLNFSSAEELYDAIISQYSMFNASHRPNLGQQHSVNGNPVFKRSA